MITQETLAVQKLRDSELEYLLVSSREVVPSERRGDVRHPYFAPFTLVPRAEPTHRISCFSREISVGGIGLLLNSPLSQGSIYELRLEGVTEKFCRTAEVMWCRPAGEGWFLAGLRFVTAAK